MDVSVLNIRTMVFLRWVEFQWKYMVLGAGGGTGGTMDRAHAALSLFLRREDKLGSLQPVKVLGDTAYIRTINIGISCAIYNRHHIYPRYFKICLTAAINRTLRSFIWKLVYERDYRLTLKPGVKSVCFCCINKKIPRTLKRDHPDPARRGRRRSHLTRVLPVCWQQTRTRGTHGHRGLKFKQRE